MHAKPISVEVFFTDWKGLVDAQCYCQFHQDKCRSFPQIVYVSLFAYCTGGGSSQSFQGTENRPVFCWESCSGKDRGDSNLVASLNQTSSCSLLTVAEEILLNILSG
ncbi:hypothetical protein ACFX2I_009344 [Malus domestica]